MKTSIKKKAFKNKSRTTKRKPKEGKPVQQTQ